MMEFAPGAVILVGGGPGDPDLLTVGGLRALRAADVVLYDRLAPVAALDECREDCERIPVGKIPRGKSTPQSEINELLVKYARAGKIVVRLKGGDPFVFGRGGEEWQHCVAADVPVQVIPGVTSSVAAPALAGIPVTHRAMSRGFSVVSGHVPPGDERSDVNWAALARTHTTLVILMGVKYLPQITSELRDAGLADETPAAVVEDAATPDMRVVHGTLATIAQAALDAQVRPPAITVIGAVAGEILSH